MGYCDYLYPYTDGTLQKIYGEPSTHDYLPHYNNGVVAEAYRRNNLTLTAGDGVTYLSPGKALLRSMVYENDATVTVAHDSTAANNRYDAVVLRWSITAVELIVLKGVEGAEPNYPSTADTVNYKYLPLAYVKLMHPFVSGTTTIDSFYIQDVRKFIETPESYTFDRSSKHNLAFNPELVVYSAASGTDTLGLPEGWAIDLGAIVTTRYTNAASDLPRSHVCGWRGNTAVIIYTHMQMPAGGSRIWGPSLGVGIPVTALVRMKLTAGKEIAVRLRSGYYDSGGMWAGITTIAESNYSYNTTTADWFNVILRGLPANPTANTADNVLRLEIEDLTPGTATEIYFEYVSATLGNVPVAYNKQSELVMCKNNAYAYYDGTFRSSDTAFFIITDAHIGAVVSDARFLLLDIRVRDSGSLAGNAYMTLYTTAEEVTLVTMKCSKAPNDQYYRQLVWLPVNKVVGGDAFKVSIEATGANTFEATVRIAGAIT